MPSYIVIARKCRDPGNLDRYQTMCRYCMEKCMTSISLLNYWDASHCNLKDTLVAKGIDWDLHMLDTHWNYMSGKDKNRRSIYHSLHNIEQGKRLGKSNYKASNCRSNLSKMMQMSRSDKVKHNSCSRV